MVGNSNGFFPDINYIHNTNEKFSLNMGYSFGALLFSRELPVVKLSPVTFLEVCTHVFFYLREVFFLLKKMVSWIYFFCTFLEFKKKSC